ncbi:TonB-dependent receptor [Sulfuriferula plumbiphila]|uniref:TonB-dependent receptor n=1 Tax=Sulfuriferula plumbiphila TaxID=171865 RepID=A0A512LBB7_9PROT|nr:TonB-dependent receptor [Sulfuriferula plumbiphila]BBP04482.1 TonB-dependent receptor [Sulfuriferula plumbiphila]GEP31784.1 TonB-dependent receptor [Sulfuriferula plumbiphila]
MKTLEISGHPVHPSRFRRTLITVVLILISSAIEQAFAGGIPTLDTVEVKAGALDLIGEADSANVGTVTRQQLEARTVYRPGELLEATPGLIVSQHSGEGKANQFYLRGFNLDHGTDLRTTVDGMLVNQRSHSHGQGWTDLNFLIPELATGLQYKKGPYYAEEGDFASAGAVSIGYANKLPNGIAELGLGTNGFRRTLLADSPKVGNGNLLYALELYHNDGPFVHPDDYRKINAVLRYSEGNAANGFNVTAMAYKAKWNATDQIAQRAIDTGLISNRFDAIDPTDGGESHRYSLSSAWQNTNETSSTKINAYVIAWGLNLFSNFTYFLDDPVNGDQFNQPDRRTTTALNASHTWQAPWGGKESENTVGIQFQNDNIFNGLFSTKARERLSTTRQDHTVESSVAVYVENSTQWMDKFRTVAGLREDIYRFDVKSNIDANSGKVTASMASPKLSLIFGPWAKTEYYLNLGSGFHSNDARGTTIAVDPKTANPADRVTPLVRSRGYEVGVRTAIIPGLQSSLSLYQLDFDSELVFAGDAGTTQAGRPSRRTGFEFANFYKPTNWLTLDADLAFAKARFRDSDPIGNRIPGAVEGVASLAIAVDNLGPCFGALQYRYFGPRPLIEDNSVRSSSTALWNGRLGYKINPKMRVELEGFNLLNKRASAIDYYYTSRLPGEPVAGVADVHFHPIESRSFRLALVANF